MKVRALALLTGVSAPFITNAAALAAFTGISTTSKPNPFGSDLAPNAALVAIYPGLAFDSFVTIGVKMVGRRAASERDGAHPGVAIQGTMLIGAVSNLSAFQSIRHSPIGGRRPTAQDRHFVCPTGADGVSYDARAQVPESFRRVPGSASTNELTDGGKGTSNDE